MYNSSLLLLPSPALQAAALQAAAIVILPIKVQCRKDLFFKCHNTLAKHFYCTNPNYT